MSLLQRVIFIVITYWLGSRCSIAASASAAAAEGRGGEEEMYATLNPELYDGLQHLVPDGYELPMNVYEWNMTEIARLIEEKIPGILCEMDTSFYQGFPLEKVQELPINILYCQRFYCLIDEEELMEQYQETYQDLHINCTDYNITSNSSSSANANNNGCYFPLVYTTRDLPSYLEGCGLSCQYKGLGEGSSPAEYEFHRQFKLIVVLVSFCGLVLLVTNQCLEHKKQKEPFCRRGVLYQSITCITILWFFVMAQMALIEIIGVDNVLCTDAGVSNARDHIVTMGNPRAGAGLCTLFGWIFYCSVVGLAYYIATFAITLCATFYGLNESFGKNHSVHCNNIKNWIGLCCMRKWPQANLTRMKTWNNSVEGNNPNRQTTLTYADSCMLCLSSPTLKWHILIWSIVFPFAISGMIRNMYSAVPSFQLCYITPVGKDVLIYIITPMLIPAILIFFCLPFVAVLLWRAARGNELLAVDIRHLSIRLSLFFFGAVFAWSWIFIYAFAAYVNDAKIREGSEARYLCAIAKFIADDNPDLTDCYSEGFRQSPWMTLFILAGSAISITCAVILSCNKTTIARWKNIGQRCGVTCCEHEKSLFCCVASSDINESNVQLSNVMNPESNDTSSKSQKMTFPAMLQADSVTVSSNVTNQSQPSV